MYVISDESLDDQISLKQYIRTVDGNAKQLCFICESEVCITPKENGTFMAAHCWFCSFQFDGQLNGWKK